MPKGEKTRKKYLVPAVEQAAKVLFCLAENQSSHMSLIEICSRVGIHKSKAFSILETLKRFGLVRRRSDEKGYTLGPGLVSLSRKVLDDLSVVHLADPILAKLAKETKNTAVLGLISDDRVFIISKHEDEVDIGITMRIGHRLPLSYGAHGKAIAAFLSDHDLEKLLQQKELYFYGSPQKFNKIRLKKELAQCRRRGYAEDIGERKGINVVAAPVLGPNNDPLGFIELLILFSTETAHQMGPKVAEAGKAISTLLGADIDSIRHGHRSAKSFPEQNKEMKWQSKRSFRKKS